MNLSKSMTTKEGLRHEIEVEECLTDKGKTMFIVCERKWGPIDQKPTSTAGWKEEDWYGDKEFGLRKKYISENNPLEVDYVEQAIAKLKEIM